MTDPVDGYEARRERLAEQKKDISEFLLSRPGVVSVDYQGDLLYIEWEDGTDLTLFPADYGGSQGAVVNQPGVGQISYRGY